MLQADAAHSSTLRSTVSCTHYHKRCSQELYGNKHTTIIYTTPAIQAKCSQISQAEGFRRQATGKTDGKLSKEMRLGLPGGLVVKKLPSGAGDSGSNLDGELRSHTPAKGS